MGVWRRGFGWTLRFSGWRLLVALVGFGLLVAACGGTQPEEITFSGGVASGGDDPEEEPVGSNADAGRSVDGGEAVDFAEPSESDAAAETEAPADAPQDQSAEAPELEDADEPAEGAAADDPGSAAAPGEPGEEPDESPQAEGGATDVGVTEDRITFGGFYIMGGPVGELGITLLKATQAVFNEVNAEGGVHGRQLEVIPCDTQFTSGELPRQCYERLTQEHDIFAFAAAGDGPAHVTGVPLMADDGIPGLWLDGLSGNQFDEEIVFPTGPPAISQARVLADYYVDAHDPDTVGILLQNDAVGEEWTEGAVQVFEDQGVEVVAQERYNLGDSDMTSQVTQMRFADPDFVFFAAEPLGPILFQTQAQGQGYETPLPDAGVTCNVNLWPEQVGEYTEGMLCMHPWNHLSDPTEEQERFIETYNRYWDDFDQYNYYTEIHWVAAKALVETLERIGPNLTRERVVEELQGGLMDGYDTGMGVTFEHQETATGGNAFMNEAAVIEIVNPAASGAQIYEQVQDPSPDPYWER